MDRAFLAGTCGGDGAPVSHPPHRLGHATVLLNFFGVRILTDPVFFGRVGASTWFGSIGPKRLTGCALGPRELPEVGLVLALIESCSSTRLSVYLPA